MIPNVTFGSMHGFEGIGRKALNPEHNLEQLKNDAERPKDFPAYPNETIGRSQVKTRAGLPHKLELSGEDKEFLSELSSSMYGFHPMSNDFWVHSKKPAKGRTPNIIMGDGRLTPDMTRHDFVKTLVNDDTQAFQIAGRDKLGGHKLITVVKNTDTDTTTMYTCDSKQCYPLVIDGDVDIQKIASSITSNLDSIQGATICEK